MPAGVTRILVEAIGAGGSGAYRKTLYGGGGGGAGGYVRAVMTVSPGAVCTVTVGDGGAAAPNEDVGNGANGSASFVDCGGAAVVTAAAGQGGFTGSGGAGGGGTLPPAPAGQDIVRTGGSGTALVVELPGSGGTAMRGSPDVEAGDGGDGSDNDTAALGGAGLPGWVLIQW